MKGLNSPPDWTSPSPDPNDRTFGDVVEPTAPEVAGAFDAVLVGVPYDGGVLGRRGASDGPDALRQLLSGTKVAHLDDGSVADIGDVGDVDFSGTGVVTGADDVAAAQDAIAEVAASIYETGTFPVFLGGDNSTTVGHVRPLLEGRSVGVVNIDAHLDCREVRDGPTSGTPYRQLLEEGLDEFCVVGARHFETSPWYVDWARDQGATLVGADDVRADLDAAIETAVSAMRDVEYAYLSLDVDALDESVAPGVSAPTPGGLTSREAFELCRRLGRLEHLAGFEVVECAPPLERGDRTARAGACAIAHALAGRQGTTAGPGATAGDVDSIGRR